MPKLLAFLLSFLLCFILTLADYNAESPRENNCTGLRIVSRSEWHARLPWRISPMKLPVNHVMVMHTVFGACNNKYDCMRNLRFLQENHMDDLGWWDIAYNFFVDEDGRIYEGVGWFNSGEHTVNYNTISIGLAFLGNYDKVTPSQKMVNAAKALISCGINKGYLTPTAEINGHRDVTCTISPGDKLYAIIKQWPHFKGGRLDQYSCDASGSNTDIGA